MPQPHQRINALDVTLAGNIQAKGVAYKEANESYEDFLRNVSANEKIIGFEWDSETEKLGIILGQ